MSCPGGLLHPEHHHGHGARPTCAARGNDMQHVPGSDQRIGRERKRDDARRLQHSLRLVQLGPVHSRARQCEDHVPESDSVRRQDAASVRDQRLGEGKKRKIRNNGPTI